MSNIEVGEFVKVKEGSQSDIFNMVYPVGSIYISVNNANPSTFFGGTWVSWGSGRVPVGVDVNDTDFDTVEETGGAKSHSYTPSGSNAAVTLTAAQSGCPAHNHGLNSHKHSVGAHSHGLNSHTHGVGTLAMSGAGEHTHQIKFAAEGGSRTTAKAQWFRGNISNTDTGDDAATVKSNGTHAHTITGATGAASGSTANSSAFDTGAASGSTANNTAANASASHNHTFTGTASTQSHLQPYITCYMWKRTA